MVRSYIVFAALGTLAALALATGCGDDSSQTPSDAARDSMVIVDDAAVPDPCPATAACPMAPADLAEGGGLRAIDRCAFPLAFDEAQRTNYSTLIDAYPAALQRVTLGDIAGDLNRAATKVASVPGNPPGLKNAWMWQSGDESVTYWTPQGVTGSFDATASGLVNGRKLVLVSWYYTMANDTGSMVDKGVRIAIADVTNPAAVAYRFALLVTPTANGFDSVKVHAGGLAWVGDRLYVPVTTGGFRVFDLSRILKMTGTADSLGPDGNGVYNAYGYAYAIPELERYTVGNATCAPRFSFVALDRAGASLISGEYDAASVRGRLYRWPVADNGDLVRTSTGRVVPLAAWFLGESHVQGATGVGETYWLSSSRPAGGSGELDRVKENAATVRLGWSDSPEDLAYDPQDDAIWSLSEGVDSRYLFEVARSAVQ
jgi:hypothetical protein